MRALLAGRRRGRAHRHTGEHVVGRWSRSDVEKGLSAAYGEGRMIKAYVTEPNLGPLSPDGTRGVRGGKVTPQPFDSNPKPIRATRQSGAKGWK